MQQFKPFFQILMMSSKGWLGSKRRVLCGYCKVVSRYDNLRRHINSVHGKEMQLKFTIIEPKDNVVTLFKKKDETSSNNNNKVDHESDSMTISDSEIVPPLAVDIDATSVSYGKKISKNCVCPLNEWAGKAMHEYMRFCSFVRVMPCTALVLVLHNKHIRQLPLYLLHMRT